MIDAYIFHGTDGNPGENWFPWLKRKLEEIDIKTTVPQLPNPAHPHENEWLAYAATLKSGGGGRNTLLIGHSLGALLILRMLERGYQAKSVYLVAPFLQDLGWDVLKESLFFTKAFDWSLIKKQCNHFEVFASKNDPYLSIEDVGAVANELETKNQILDVNKHFNVTELPYLLERIKLVL